MTLGTVLGAVLSISMAMRIRRTSLTEGPKPESLARLSRGTTYVIAYAVAATVFATALAWVETISPDSSLGQVARVGGTALVGTILPTVVVYVLSKSMGTDRDAASRARR